MQFQSHYNRFLLSLEGTKNIYVSFCENIISFCAPRTFRFADYTQTFQTSNYFQNGNSSSRQPLSIPQHFLCRSKQRLTRRIAAKHPQVLTF